jgi:RNA polymerase sigma factor (sigma-70 family)
VEGRPRVEAELVERARGGDVAAFELLVRAHQEVAVRTAWFISGGADDAEDAAQEGFVKAFGALSRFKRGAPFRPWLLTIVANEARNRRRSAGRREALALRLSEDRRPDGAAPSPESAVLADERRVTLLAALSRLDEGDRLVIALRHLMDLSEAETAAALDIPRGTVKSRLSRALDRLRSELQVMATEGRWP